MRGFTTDIEWRCYVSDVILHIKDSAKRGYSRRHKMDFEVWILLLCLIVTSAGQILVSKKEISVDIGRSVFLRKDDLVFVDTTKKSECRVEVVQNDPITQRVGRLEPTVRKLSLLISEYNTCRYTGWHQLSRRKGSFYNPSLLTVLGLSKHVCILRLKEKYMWLVRLQKSHELPESKIKC